VLYDTLDLGANTDKLYKKASRAMQRSSGRLPIGSLRNSVFMACSLYFLRVCCQELNWASFLVVY